MVGGLFANCNSQNYKTVMAASFNASQSGRRLAVAELR